MSHVPEEIKSVRAFFLLLGRDSAQAHSAVAHTRACVEHLREALEHLHTSVENAQLSIDEQWQAISALGSVLAYDESRRHENPNNPDPTGGWRLVHRDNNPRNTYLS